MAIYKGIKIERDGNKRLFKLSGIYFSAKSLADAIETIDIARQMRMA